jgi:phytanoyl-CoA hydroxylase
MDDISKRDEQLAKLQLEIDAVDITSSSSYNSWVCGQVSLPDTTSPIGSYPSARCQFLDKHGFILVPSFAEDHEVQSMKDFMKDLVENEWDPSQTQVFRTDQKQIEAQGRSDYFLDSASKTHYFAEKDAMDENGKLKKEYHKNKIAALNKAGHGTHTSPGPFQTYTKSAKTIALLRELGWKDPVVPQSMYIFKQGRIGGEVTSHQDSTFLYTTPRQTCIGLWLALDDATLDNGCLWVRPGSHSESVRRQFVRNPKHFGESLDYSGGDAGDQSEPQMIFRQLNQDHVTWEGKLPENSLPTPDCTGLYEAGFVPVPCKAGDLLAFVGELDHLSLPNFSDKARHTFQLHCVEGEGAGVQWSRENWLQYPKGTPFMKL